MTKLMRIEEAAASLGVPTASLKTAAEKHGYLVRMGRAVRIDGDKIGELVEKCQGQPKEQDSTSSSTARTGTSATRASPTAQRAARIAEKLKKCSGPTSPQKAGQVLPMNRKT